MGFPEDDRAEKKFEARLRGAAIGLMLGLLLIAKCTPDPEQMCEVYCAQSEKKIVDKPKVGFWTLGCPCVKKERTDLRIIQP
jgi:hypothetical protein